MATGVETAGLVLAVFPLVVKGMQYYAEGLQTIQFWRRYRRELQNHARRIKTQWVRYLNTIELLFGGIVGSDEELAALVNDPGGNLWQEPKYEDSLRLRLDHSYEHFLDILKTMIKTLRMMATKLGMDASGEISWDRHSSFEREMKRLDLVLFQKKYHEMLDMIEKSNQDLGDFTRASKDLETIRRRRRTKCPHESFKSIRQQAKSLYNALIEGKSWSCMCKNGHAVGLRLEPLMVGMENSTAQTALQSRFRILVSRPLARPQSQSFDPEELPCEWRELDVEPQRAELQKKEPQKIEPQMDHYVNQTANLVTAHPKKPGKKKARILEPAQHSGPERRHAALNKSTTSSQLIHDLCATLSQDTSPGGIVGFLVDDGMPQYQHHLYCLSHTEDTAKRRSLKSLLSKPRPLLQYRPVKLTRGDRLSIAVTLALSVLQLDSSMWLRKRWTSEDVIFHLAEGDISAPSNSALKHPYLYWKVFPARIDTTVLPIPKAYHVRSEALLDLGLTLVELSFGEVLSEMQEAEDVNEDLVATRLSSARRLLGKVYNESGGRYGDAVRRCFDCPYDFRELDFEDDNFQEAVYNTIVVPLVQDLKDFN